jgi:hypothetical protein
MQSHGEIPLYSRRPSTIRWPFRLLALILVAGTVLATLGNAYVAFRHKDPTAALLALATAPVAALVGRLGVHALWNGAVVRDPYWPFASGAVVAAWLLLVWAVGSFR